MTIHEGITHRVLPGRSVLKWRKRVRNLAIVTASIAAFFDPSKIESLAKDKLRVISLGVALAAIALYVIVLAIGRLVARRRLSALDLDSKNADRARPIVFLYLRSFDLGKSSIVGRLFDFLDPQISRAPMFWTRWFVFWTRWFGSGANRGRFMRHDPEEMLADAIDAHGILLAIGEKGHSYGASKVVTPDESWRSKFESLADDAIAIFLMPGTSVGLMWEAGQILDFDKWRSKTIFVMPRNWYADEWKELAASWQREVNVDLPPYFRSGAYFLISETRRCTDIVTPEDLIGGLEKAIAEYVDASKTLTLGTIWSLAVHAREERQNSGEEAV